MYLVVWVQELKLCHSTFKIVFQLVTWFHSLLNGVEYVNKLHSIPCFSACSLDPNALNISTFLNKKYNTKYFQRSHWRTKGSQYMFYTFSGKTNYTFFVGSFLTQSVLARCIWVFQVGLQPARRHKDCFRRLWLAVCVVTLLLMCTCSG